MDKGEIITAVAGITDKSMLSRIADVLNHRYPEPTRVREADTRLITQREAARRLGVSNTTVWRLIRERSLKTIAVRGKRRVQMDSLLSYVGVK